MLPMSDEEFLGLLREKMDEADLPRPVVALLETHRRRIFTGYNPQDAADIVILNNKVLHLCDMARDAGIGDGDDPLPPHLQEAFLRVLSTKH